MSNIIRDRRDAMILAFSRALDEAERCLDNNQDSVAYAGVPKFTAHVTFTFPSGTTIETLPEFHLDEDTPPGVQAEELPVLGPWEPHHEILGLEFRKNLKTGGIALLIFPEENDNSTRWNWSVVGKGVEGHDKSNSVSRAAVDIVARGLGYQLQD